VRHINTCLQDRQFKGCPVYATAKLMLNFNSTAKTRFFFHINHPIKTADLSPMYVLQTHAVTILPKTFRLRIKFIWNDVFSSI